MAHSFDIKSGQLPLVALLVKTPDTARLITDLTEQFGPQSDSPDFFDRDALLLDFISVSQLDDVSSLTRLIAALQNCRLKPIAFRNASAEQSVVALRCNLLEAPADIHRIKAEPKRVEKAPVSPTVQEVIREVTREVVREIPGPSTMVIDKPLRSGQKIYARGADLVILAMVNMGAEVAADGNIHVYAPLRGKAMAGANGNVNARIFSLCMEPELVAIAGIYRTSEHPLSGDIQGKPAQIRLSNDGQDKLIFEALNP